MSDIRVGKCPLCKMHVETDILPLACSDHRREVDKKNKERLHKLHTRKGKKEGE